MVSSCLVSCLLVGSLGEPAHAQQPVERLGLYTTVADFHGFALHEFTFNGRACKVAAPEQAAEGRPWAWRARFWGHEPQTDIALLQQGWHIVYCDVVELFGNAKAIDIWNKFYQKMRQIGLAKKTAFIAMSRGGVYAYNWAVANPGKVACIYADAPVLDMRSWPGGMGSGPGSPPDWELCRQAWNLRTEADIKAFRQSPIERVEEIVKAGFPMLHVCGDADEVVPVSENTDVFEQKVKALGGNITVIRKAGVKHHPHSLPDPAPIVQFIIKNSIKL